MRVTAKGKVAYIKLEDKVSGTRKERGGGRGSIILEINNINTDLILK